jgi:anti-sigma-K factor RskA
MSADHDLFAELAAGYALSAVSAEERAAFEAHLAGCERCQAEMRSLAPVVGALAQAVPQHDPPAALRARVLREATGVVVHDKPVPSLSPPPPMAGWLAAAAAALVAVGLGWHAMTLRSRVAALEARLEEANARVVGSERQVADATRGLNEARVALAVLASPDLARVDLAGQQAAPAARGRAFWSRSTGLVFTASNLPQAPAGRTYQLWVVTAEAPISAGLLEPDAAGRVTAVVMTDPAIAPPVAMAVTLEPAGGVPAPTGDKYLVGVPSI